MKTRAIKRMEKKLDREYKALCELEDEGKEELMQAYNAYNTYVTMTKSISKLTPKSNDVHKVILNRYKKASKSEKYRRTALSNFSEKYGYNVEIEG